MASCLPQDHEYYVVFKGRVDQPTIYTSWSQAHPRVIRSKGANNDYKERKFKSLQDARSAIKSKGYTEWGEVIKDKPEEQITPSPRGKFYAVVGCETTEIFNSWEEAKKATTGTTACYRLCGSENEANEFIREWKDSYADVWRRAIRRGLDSGWKAKNMEFDLSSVLVEENIAQRLKRLGLKEEPWQ